MSTRIQLVVGIWLTALVSLLGLAYSAVRPRSMPQAAQASPSTANCRTRARDPNPPLNVRSSPLVAQDNVVGTIDNGTQLSVLAQESGWLKVNAPISGWVYQPLTQTICHQASVPSLAAQDPRSPSLQVIGKAQEHFQAGQLKAAQTLLETIPASDLSYPQAQTARQTMAAQWQQGQQAYKIAQLAIKEGHWQAVLAIVNQVPDIRYWRSKMAPIVKRAIHQQAQNRVVEKSLNIRKIPRLGFKASEI